MTTSAINISLPSFLDLKKSMDPNGAPAQVVEMLAGMNEIVKDAVVTEGNETTGHQVTQRTGLPSAYWRKMNQGVAASKSRKNQFVETAAILSSQSKVSVEMANLHPAGANAYRMGEAASHIEAMSQEMESTILYGNLASAPDELNGLIPRFAATTDPGGSQIIKCDDDASGADQHSVLLVGWGERTVHLFYPRGAPNAGIVHTPKNDIVIKDDDNYDMLAHVDFFDWRVGLAVEDFRYVVRVCNIDSADLLNGTSNLIDAMIEAFHKCKREGVRLAWYCDRDVGTYLHKQALNKVAGSTLSIEDDLVNGGPITKFMKVPVRESTGFVATESVVS